MPLDPKKIAAFREKVAQSTDEINALSMIAPLDPKKSIPVLLQILTDLVAICEDMETKKFLAFAFQVLTEADEKQNVSLFNLHSVLKGLTKEKIDSDLGKLIGFVPLIKITHGNLKLWRETALWLEGIYRHTYDAAYKYYNGVIKPDKYGKIGPIDIEDQIFHGLTGLTKYHIALYYHQAAEALNAQIHSECTHLMTAEKTEVKDVQPEKKDKREVVEAKLEQVHPETKSEHSARQETPHLFEVKKNDGITQIIMSIPENQLSKLPLMEDAIIQILTDSSVKQDIPSSPILDKDEPIKLGFGLTRLLETFKDEDIHVRVAVLIYGLDQFQLTKNEDLIIRQYLPIIISKMESYSSAWFTVNWVPNIFGRWHDGAVSDAKIDLKRDSKSNLKALFNLWVRIDGEGSRELYGKITALLEGVYSILLKGNESQLLLANGGF